MRAALSNRMSSGSGELNYGSSGDGGSDILKSMFESHGVVVLAAVGLLILAIIIIFTLSSIVMLHSYCKKNKVKHIKPLRVQPQHTPSTDW
jgi:hypothetical protein